jgi:tetratricopeptide (TPR) repeat protein
VKPSIISCSIIQILDFSEMMFPLHKPLYNQKKTSDLMTPFHHYETVFTALKDLANHYFFAGNLSESLRLLQAAVEISQNSEISLITQAELKLDFGEKHLYWATVETGDFQPAIQIAEDLLSTENAIQRGKALSLLGAVAYHQAMNTKERDFSKAQAFLNDALAILESTEDIKALFWARFRLGLCQQFSQQREQALESFQRVDKLALEQGLDFERSFSIRHLGMIYQEQGDLDVAIMALEESLRLRENLNFKLYLSLSYAALAAIYRQSQRHAEALKLYEKAYFAAKEVGMARPLVIVSLDYGAALQAENRLKEAREIFEAALPLARKIGHVQAVSLIEAALEQIEGDSNKFRLA